MNAIEIARKFAKLDQVPDAQYAYALALEENNGEDPAIDFESASYIFYSGGNYRIAYTYFISLYNRGHFQSELFDILVSAFYAPNVKLQEKTYQRNCKLLAKYTYLFRKDFLPFDDLPIKFFPFGEEGFTPFFPKENRFGPYLNFDEPVIGRNFFHDLDHPIIASDVFSQYELEYLNDNVRRSEWVGRENHVYLHYSDWATFCSYLSCLNLRELLKSEKLVFLIEDELALYPIDFKEQFGIDYSQYPVKPISVREIHRLIWHTQLAAHNGGDFFNEIFYGHPNLLADQSLMFRDIQKRVESIKQLLKQARQNHWNLSRVTSEANLDKNVFRHLSLMKDLTDKDILVGLFLSDIDNNQGLDRNSRIAPVLFFQPHFPNILYNLTTNVSKQAILDSEQYAAIRNSSIFQDFKYIKTFTPMRRITTSYAATVKFMYAQIEKDEKSKSAIPDVVCERLLNRSFMIDWQDRLYQDSVLVRFEDGKLNPKATFTALAAFLDLPYTHSMTYCSGRDGINPESLPGNALGFDPSTVYRTYDAYANDAERYFLEYFLRDAYETYGYEFQYYDGAPVDENKVKELIAEFDTLNGYIKASWQNILADAVSIHYGDTLMQKTDSIVQKRIENHNAKRLQIAQILMNGLNFINRNGQPLKMMTPLQLDPALLEQPLYH